MYWNHRIVKATDEQSGETMLVIAEVFYNSDTKRPFNYGEAFLISETLDGIKEIVTQFEAAAKQPILSYPEDFDVEANTPEAAEEVEGTPV